MNRKWFSVILGPRAIIQQWSHPTLESPSHLTAPCKRICLICLKFNPNMINQYFRAQKYQVRITLLINLDPMLPFVLYRALCNRTVLITSFYKVMTILLNSDGETKIQYLEIDEKAKYIFPVSWCVVLKVLIHFLTLVYRREASPKVCKSGSVLMDNVIVALTLMM